uniref:Uncharacterized protein n=1 Tax=Anguilla anguilla TaxID=7936 RepID=A0A0E9UU83_ANGAN
MLMPHWIFQSNP